MMAPLLPSCPRRCDRALIQHHPDGIHGLTKPAAEKVAEMSPETFAFANHDFFCSRFAIDAAAATLQFYFPAANIHISPISGPQVTGFGSQDCGHEIGPQVDQSGVHVSGHASDGSSGSGGSAPGGSLAG